MGLFKKDHAKIVKHHRNSNVYIDGRYLHVDAIVSMRSKKGRQLARETAEAILSQVGLTDAAFFAREQTEPPLLDDPTVEHDKRPNDDGEGSEDPASSVR